MMLKNDTYIRDEKGFCIQAKPGQVGELISKMDDVKFSIGRGGEFAGYTDPKATEKKLLRDVFEKGDCWFKTGDLLKVDEQNYFYFVDRIGDTFRWRGENVSTIEVAGVLSHFPGIQEVNVYGVTVPGHEGRAGMASIVMDKSSTFPWNQLYEYLEKNMPIYAIPLFLRIQTEIQKTSTFKQTKNELVKQGFNPHDCMEDPVFFRDDKQKTYVRLNQQIYNDIVQGKVNIK